MKPNLHNPTRECECGNVKEPHDSGCERCTRLENQTREPILKNRVLSRLRFFDWVESSDLYQALETGGYDYEAQSLAQVLRRLVRGGTVLRQRFGRGGVMYKLATPSNEQQVLTCRRCNQPRVEGRVVCAKHLAWQAAARRKQYAKRKEKLLCPDCGIEKSGEQMRCDACRDALNARRAA